MHVEVSPRMKRWALPLAAALILLGGGVTATALALESPGGSTRSSGMTDIEELKADVAELRRQMDEALTTLEEISAAQPKAEEVDDLSEQIASLERQLGEVVAALDQLSESQVTRADLQTLRDDVAALSARLDGAFSSDPTVYSTPGGAPAVLPLQVGSTLEWRGMMLAVERADPDPVAGGTAFTIENLAADNEAASALRDISVSASSGSFCRPKFAFPGDSDLIPVERGQRFTFEVSWACAAGREPTGVVFGDVVVFEFPDA